MRLVLLSLVLLLAWPAVARAQEGSITPAVDALARGYVYEDPSAEAAREIDAPALDALIRRSDTGPLFVAVLPESAAMGGTINDVLQALRREAGIAGTYVVVLGRDVRAGSDDGSLEAGEHMTGALRAHPGDIQATLVDYVDRIEREQNPAGFGWWWLLLATPFIFAAVAFPIAIASSVRKGRRRRAADLAEVKRNVRDDLVALGEDIRALEVDVELGSADVRSAYADAVRAYERANRAFETATRVSELKPAAEALEEGRYAMTWAREVLAGRTPPERRAPCFFDPRHGPSSRDVMWAPESGGSPRAVPACEADAQRVERHEEPAAREVERDGRRVPYWEAGPAYAPFYGGFYPGLLIGSMVAGGWDDPTPTGDSGGWGGDSGGGWGGDFGGGGGDFGGGGGDFGGGGF